MENSKINILSGKERSNQAPSKETGKKPEKQDTIPIAFTPQLKLGILTLAIILLLVLFVSFIGRRPISVLDASPSPQSSFVQPTGLTKRQVSDFGKTQEFQSFEQKLSTLRQENVAVDLSESKLSFPLLNMDVNFNK